MTDMKIKKFMNELEDFLIINDELSNCLLILSQLNSKINNYEKDHCEKYLSCLVDNYLNYSCVFNPLIEVLGKPLNIEKRNEEIIVKFFIELKGLELILLIDNINKCFCQYIKDDEDIESYVKDGGGTLDLHIKC